MTHSSAPKKIINLNKPKAAAIKKVTDIKKVAAIKKADAPKHIRADSSYDNGIHKKDKFGKPYYSTWAKDCCPPEYRMLV